MTDADTPILATKLRAPRRRRAVVPRARLRDRLDQPEPATVTLVSAPAGFGKTTLVADAFADRPDTAWLSLDRLDSDPLRFWTYVIAALQTVDPTVGTDAQALLRAPQADIEAVVATLLNELLDLERDVVLVLDDYHAIESADVHRSMAFLTERASPNVHVVIASRADPPLPLASLRARGDLAEYRAADLRFTEEEAAAYLNGQMGLSIAPTDIAVLEGRTEGWIAALQLAALSMQNRDDPAAFIAGFAGDDRFILDYLVGEVLDGQDDAVRRFLLETSVLDRLTGPLCDTVTGRPGGRATLEELDRSNLFLVPLDDRRTWYRYHHLFTDVLRARLLDESPALVPDLHRRASDWCDEHGDRDAAIGHALAGGHDDRAAELIERAAPAMRQARQEASLRRWLDALPGELLEDRPVLGLTLVGARMATGDPTGVDGLLAQIEARLARPSPPPIVFDHDEYARLPAQLAVYRAALALLGADPTETIAQATRALELTEPDDQLRHGSAAALLGLAHWSLGELEVARTQYADAVHSLVAAAHVSDALGCSLALADIQLAQGRLDDAIATYESGLRLAADLPGMRGTADLHVGLAEVLMERNDLDDADRHLAISDALGEAAGLPQHAYRWRVATARRRQAAGDLDEAIELLEEAVPRYNTDFSPPVRPVGALLARAHLARGDVAAAERWATDRGLTPDDELSYVREFEHLTLARLLLARPSPAPHAIALLERLRTAAEQGDRPPGVIDSLVWLAAAHHARDDEPLAIAALDEALARAEPEGQVRVFLEGGPAVTSLLATLAAQEAGVAGERARRLLAAADPPAVDGPPRTGLVDELSERELDVLRLLRSDLSGPEIARELHISLNTMRTHTKHIYTKLGARNRREAVRRAADVGL